jgi:uncharacterized membrane protein
MAVRSLVRSRSRRAVLRVFAAATSAALLAACNPAPPAPPPVSFHKDVVPIMEKHCVSCHAPGKPGTDASGFVVDSYAAVMKGTKLGPVVLPGDAISSTLIRLVEGRADPSINMPHGQGDKLSAAEIATLRAWVQQGAKND